MRALSLCARAAAADAAFMRAMFPGEAVEEYASAMALTPPAGAERRNDVALATTAQRKAFDEWRGASLRGITECTETCGITEFAAVSTAAMEAATPWLPRQEHRINGR
jgi:hypothetical protein